MCEDLYGYGFLQTNTLFMREVIKICHTHKLKCGIKNLKIQDILNVVWNHKIAYWSLGNTVKTIQTLTLGHDIKVPNK